MNFDKVVVYQGETNQVTPLVLSGDVDYATHGFPLATDKAFRTRASASSAAPLYTGPALYFHWEKAPEFQDKRLRRRSRTRSTGKRARQITYGDSGKAPKYMAGFRDSIVPNWINSGRPRPSSTPYAFDSPRPTSS